MVSLDRYGPKNARDILVSVAHAADRIVLAAATTRSQTARKVKVNDSTHNVRVQAMPLKKFAGLVIGGAGIAWYSQIKFSEGAAAKPATSAPPPPAPIHTDDDEATDGGGGGLQGGGGSGGRSLLGGSDGKNGGLPPAESFEVHSGVGNKSGARNWAGQVVSPRRGHKQ